MVETWPLATRMEINDEKAKRRGSGGGGEEKNDSLDGQENDCSRLSKDLTSSTTWAHQDCQRTIPSREAAGPV